MAMEIRGFCTTLRLGVGVSHRFRYANIFNKGARYPCENCTSVYSKEGSLKTHLRYECGQPPRFKCPYCDLVSKKTSNVKQHIRRKHKDYAVYVHDLRRPRGYQFYRTGGKPYADGQLFNCPNCTSVFCRRQGLREHLKYACGQPPGFQCPYCEHRAHLISNLYKHVRHELSAFERLIGERDVSTSFALRHDIKFPCPNCSSVFNRKNNLKKHLKYECGQLPRFKCPYCVYRSKKTSNVRAHVRAIHLGSTVYVIDLNAVDPLRDNSGWE
ncbi:hypothetical protein KM043_007641 [Ampulex compressa]|nr:hypothetical protein KM043_007641 [Ampulex compressa]